ncbi:MAG: amidase [Alcaligenes aquatilis]
MRATITGRPRALDRGETTSVELTQQALDRIQDESRDGAAAFIEVFAEQALAAAKASDILRAAGLSRSLVEGLPMSVKNLHDIAGYVTLGGSAVLKDAESAERHATIVERLLRAGAILIGSTNMTEFAFSGLGINPHYGTPRSVWDRDNARIPGGSSSGAGVAVAQGMSVFSIGTDTGGSIRIPSAFNGLTGFKPTAERVPSEGTMPLSRSLDSNGPLAASVECCAIVDSILTDQPYVPVATPALDTLRLAVPKTFVFDGIDETVRAAFDRAITLLREQGAVVEEINLPEFDQLPQINRKGGFVCAEAWSVHRDTLQSKGEQYDPRVASRILRGKDIDCADYIELQDTRQAWISAVESRLERYDAVLMPTVPVVAPRIADLQASDEVYFATNGLVLRNPTLINFLDGCALSLPCHAADEAPVGLMVAAPAYHDEHLLAVGAAIERVLPLRKH